MKKSRQGLTFFTRGKARHKKWAPRPDRLWLKAHKPFKNMKDFKTTLRK